MELLPMKLFIKRCLYALIERHLLLQFRLNSLNSAQSASLSPMLQTLEQQLDKVWSSLWSHQAQLQTLLAKESLEVSEIGDFTQRVIRPLHQQLFDITQALSWIDDRELPSELTIFTQSLAIEKLWPDNSKPITVLPKTQALGATQSYKTETTDVSFVNDNVIVESLPWIGLSSPLVWVNLSQAFFTQYTQQSAQLQSMLSELADLKVDPWTLVPLLNLRLMGPAYYAYFASRCFYQAQPSSYWFIEPLLFQGLNRYGFVNKDMVLLHQTLEKLRPVLEDKTQTEAPLPNLSDEQREKMLFVAEKLLPEKLAFTEKSFFRAQRLQERLSEGVLISAIPMVGSPEQLYSDVTDLLEGRSDQSIYPILEQVQESPATPIEILNAGWLQVLAESNTWVTDTMVLSSEDAKSELSQTVFSLQTLLIKSIETAQVFSSLISPNNRISSPHGTTTLAV